MAKASAKTSAKQLMKSVSMKIENGEMAKSHGVISRVASTITRIGSMKQQMAWRGMAKAAAWKRQQYRVMACVAIMAPS
jgi:sensor domain CHASE-containing protein